MCWAHVRVRRVGTPGYIPAKKKAFVYYYLAIISSTAFPFLVCFMGNHALYLFLSANHEVGSQSGQKSFEKLVLQSRKEAVRECFELFTV
jgi:hypothetical protein